jgi:predicted GIY-YIG superfamily endonuclease
MPQVYLIHLDQPLGQPQPDEARRERGLPDRKREYRPHAQHYIGTADDLTARINEHRSGQGARFLSVANSAGIDWRVVRTWKGGRQLERKLKRRHDAPRLCPVCNPQDWKKLAKG